MKKPAVYYRVSSKKQQERESIETQKQVLQPYMDRKGQPYDEFWDPGISGEEIDSRPDFKRLLEESERGERKEWYFYHPDRIGRFKAPLDRARVMTTIIKHQIHVYTYDGEDEHYYDPTNPEHQAALEQELLDARVRNLKLSKDVRRGQQRVRREGKWASGGVPFFVDWNPKTKRYEVNHTNWNTFAEVLRLLQRDLGLHQTVNILSADLQQYPTRSGDKEWSTGTISGWFHPRKGFPKDLKYQFYYTGIHYQNIMDKDGRPKSESEWVPVDIGLQIGRQYLFGEEVIKEVVIKMGSRRKKRKEGEDSLFVPDDFLLEGLVECGICGGNLGIQAQDPDGKKVYRYYKCSNRDKGKCSFRFVQADRLDMNVLISFLETVSDPEKLQQAIIEEELLPKSKRRDVESLLRKAKEDREQLLDSLDRLEIAHASNRIREKAYESQRQEWEKALAEAEITIRRAKHTLSRPDDFMRVAKAASEWLAKRVGITVSLDNAKRFSKAGKKAAKKIVLNTNELPPEEKRLTFAQVKSMLARFVVMAGKIQVWNTEQFIIAGILPNVAEQVTGPTDTLLISSAQSIRGK